MDAAVGIAILLLAAVGRGRARAAGRDARRARPDQPGAARAAPAAAVDRAARSRRERCDLAAPRPASSRRGVALARARRGRRTAPAAGRGAAIGHPRRARRALEDRWRLAGVGVDRPASGATVDADPVRLGAALDNLVANALATARGPVRVRALDRGGRRPLRGPRRRPAAAGSDGASGTRVTATGSASPRTSRPSHGGALMPPRRGGEDGGTLAAHLAADRSPGERPGEPAGRERSASPRSRVALRHRLRDRSPRATATASTSSSASCAPWSSSPVSCRRRGPIDRAAAAPRRSSCARSRCASRRRTRSPIPPRRSAAGRSRRPAGLLPARLPPARSPAPRAERAAAAGRRPAAGRDHGQRRRLARVGGPPRRPAVDVVVAGEPVTGGQGAGPGRGRGRPADRARAGRSRGRPPPAATAGTRPWRSTRAQALELIEAENFAREIRLIPAS